MHHVAIIKDSYKSILINEHAGFREGRKMCSAELFMCKKFSRPNDARQIFLTCSQSCDILIEEHEIAPVGILPAGVFIWRREVTDAEILTLVDRLERCLLGKTEFHHRDHLAVATVYLYAGDLSFAIERMRTSLTRFAAHHGVAGLYHETLTCFWLQQVEMRLDRTLCLAESVLSVQKVLADKTIVFGYYSREILNSEEARHTKMDPDLL